MGIGLICLAFIVEMVAIEPPGIYSYESYGYRGFKIGLSREQILNQINKVSSIRRIITCDSADLTNPADQTIDLKLTSRRFFEMTPGLKRCDVWICRGKKKIGFLLQFQGDSLARVLRLKSPLFEEGASLLFDRCLPEIYQDLEGYLNSQTAHKIFYED